MNPNSDIDPLQNSVAGGDSKAWNSEDYEWDAQNMRAKWRGTTTEDPNKSNLDAPADDQPLGVGCSSPATLAGDLVGSVQEMQDGDAGGTWSQPSGRGGSSKTKSNDSRAITCQADGCRKSLASLTYYHVRNRICDVHIKADVFVKQEQELRFCQKCGHAHPLADFDGFKHSCRKQLEKHNARRRKRQGKEAATSEEGTTIRRKGRKVASSSNTTSSGGEGEVRRSARLGRTQRPRLKDDFNHEMDDEISGYEQLNAARAASPRILLQEQASLEARPRPLIVPTAMPQVEPPRVIQQQQQEQRNRAHSPSLPLLDFNLDSLTENKIPVLDPDTDVLTNLSNWLNEQLSHDINPIAPGVPGSQGNPGQAPLGTQAPSAFQDTRPPFVAAGSSYDVAASLMHFPSTELMFGDLEFPAFAGQGSSRAALSDSNVGGIPLQSSVAPQLTEQAALSMVSVKLFGCTPSELPLDLKDQLMTWFERAHGGNIGALEGYLRPGCVHLTAQALVENGDGRPGQQRQQPQQPKTETKGSGAGSGCCSSKKRCAEAQPEGGVMVKRIVSQMLDSGTKLWQSKTMLVQADGYISLVHAGKLQATWNIDLSRKSRAVPSIVEINPPVLLKTDRNAMLHVLGVNLLQDDCELLCRLQGRYLQIQEANCADCSCTASIKACCAAEIAASPDQASAWETNCCGCCVSKLQLLSLDDKQPRTSAAQETHTSSCCKEKKQEKIQQPASTQTIDVTLNSQLITGLLHVDVQKGAIMAAKTGKALVVDTVEVRDELVAFLGKQPGATESLLTQLGTVYEWLGNRTKIPYSIVERTIVSLMHFAARNNLMATIKKLWSVLESEVVRAAVELQSSCQVQGADGLAFLLSVDKACKSAVLNRIMILGAAQEGYTLLHASVKSQNPEMVQLVLAWGEEAECPWQNDAPGLKGLTPLHLATLAADPAIAAQLILYLVNNCPPGFSSWALAQTEDGLTPADFAKRAGRVWLLDALNVSSPALPPCHAEKQKQQQLVKSTVEGEDILDCDPLAVPPTPKRCRCKGDCPCAKSTDPCSGCSGEDKKLACGAENGTCCCCAASEPSVFLTAARRECCKE